MNRGAEARQGSNRFRLVAAEIVVLAMVLCGPAAAHADSGGATVRALPESSSVGVSAQVDHSCESETSCAWFGAAAVYSASSGCPYSFDATHGVWQSGIEQLGLPADGDFTISGFTLAKMETTIVVCLYVYSEGSTALTSPSFQSSYRPRNSAAANESAGTGTPPSPYPVPQRTVQAGEGAKQHHTSGMDYAPSRGSVPDRESGRQGRRSVPEPSSLFGACGPAPLDMYPAKKCRDQRIP